MKRLLTLNQVKRLARWLAYGISVVLLIALVCWMALPAYLKSSLEQQVEIQTGRQLKVGKVDVNPLTLTANVSDIVLYEADNKSPAFSASNLLLKASFVSLWRAAPVLREVVLTNPSLQLIRQQQDGKELTNFSDVIARLAARPARAESFQYSISNIQLVNGVIHFDDRVVAKKIQIEAITLRLPFVSSFASASDIFIEPGLSAKIDGNWIELKGRSKPFLDKRETSVEINLNQYDLTQIIPFWPKPLPFKVLSAKLSSKLLLNFSMLNQTPTVTLSGTAKLNEVALADLADAPLLKTKTIQLSLQQANLTTSMIALTSLEIDEPQIWIGLNQRGALNWLAADKKTVPAATPVVDKKALIDLAHFQLKNGTVHWSDATQPTPAIAMKFSGLNIDAKKISTNEKAPPAQVTMSIAQDNQANNQTNKAQADFSGTIDPLRATVLGQLTLANFNLPTYQPYMNRFMAANLSGRLSLKTQLVIRDGKLNLTALSGTLKDAKLQATSQELRDSNVMSAKNIAIENLSVNSELKQIKIEKIQFDQAQGDVSRDARGVLNVNYFLKDIDNRKTKTETVKTSKGWLATVNQIALTDSQFVFADKSKKPIVSIQADAVQAKFENLSSQFDRPVKLTLSANLNKTGKLAVAGSVEKKSAQLNVDVQNFSIVALQPYFTDFLNITLEKGSVGAKGKLMWNAPTQIKYQGNLNVMNFDSSEKEKSTGFMRWKTLKMSGVEFNLGTPRQSITLGNIDLADFYARAILSEQGKLNLQSILVQQKIEKAVEKKVETAKSDLTASTAKAASAVLLPATSQINPPVIKVGHVDFKNGTINYTDNFIKPHYSMRMTGMTGTIGAFQSDIAQPASLNLNGKIDNDAPITISGSLNPLFSPVQLDIKMTANGIDLPRLTSYSAKYAGYSIEKGKLSLSVEYHIKDNRLSADNTLKIDRLTLGKKVNSPDAPNLPIPLLLSLLADGNGQINLNVPISGTINDPEFSIPGLFFRALMGMISKVLFAPFALLANSVSGASELSHIEFASGSATLTDAAKTKLDSLAKALAERPQLILDVTGRADLRDDTAGLRERRLSRQVRKITESKEGDDDDNLISDAERSSAVKKIYSDAKFDKPRNFIGLSKSLPLAEMESLIKSNMAIDEDDLRSLAVRRASVVRNYLAENAHVASERMYTIAPRITGMDGNESDDKKDKATMSRVDFDLKM